MIDEQLKIREEALNGKYMIGTFSRETLVKHTSTKKKEKKRRHTSVYPLASGMKRKYD